MKKNSDLFSNSFLKEIKQTVDLIDIHSVNSLVNKISKVRKKQGRIFFIGVGGSAANSSHSVNDFRKICNIETYSLMDNFSEISARINDEGWDSSLKESLKINNLTSKDAIFVLSVGGGNLKKKVSVNIIEAIKFAKQKKSSVFSIVSSLGGFTKKHSDASVVININNKSLITPITESFQSIILHLIVTHPMLKISKTKW
ncbi:SIS domain-containing protein [Pelagibacteraceae bacterium]|nr:SIS domain-containing protein [Pelagibacteraceae bacterium]